MTTGLPPSVLWGTMLEPFRAPGNHPLPITGTKTPEMAGPRHNSD